MICLNLVLFCYASIWSELILFWFIWLVCLGPVCFGFFCFFLLLWQLGFYFCIIVVVVVFSSFCLGRRGLRLVVSSEF